MIFSPLFSQRSRTFAFLGLVDVTTTIFSWIQTGPSSNWFDLFFIPALPPFIISLRLNFFFRFWIYPRSFLITYFLTLMTLFGFHTGFWYTLIGLLSFLGRFLAPEALHAVVLSQHYQKLGFSAMQIDPDIFFQVFNLKKRYSFVICQFNMFSSLTQFFPFLNPLLVSHTQSIALSLFNFLFWFM